MQFRDRNDAGQKLAEALIAYQDKPGVLVVALPRGGVVLGRIVADALGAPLDIVVPRKIGAPWHEEYAIGAIGEMGDAVWNEEEKARTPQHYLENAVTREQTEAQRRLNLYRAGLPPRDFKNKTVIIVDDGIATGLTMRAAIATVRAGNPKKLVVAVPVAPPESLAMLRAEADEVITVMAPAWLTSVGEFYRDFPQIDDATVEKLLRQER